MAIQGRHEEAGRIPTVFQLGEPCDSSEPVTYTIELSPAHQKELEDKMEELAARGGPWLTKEQVEQYTKPTPASLEAVQSYLSQHGLGKDQVEVQRSGEKLVVHSTAAQVDQMWDTKLAHFHNTQTGADVVRSTQGYTVPQALSDAVLNLSPFASFATMSHGPIHVRPVDHTDL